ncbi:MAG TPA: histidine--tRNA ligase [Candidatus Lustribacter sp.]|nr:histidine--tRNA ligase [Candidatus Lustribacter sp.]
MNRLAAPRGTHDVLPPRSADWNRLEGHARDIAERFGYGEIRTPTFEATELFVRGVGETTDIVEKEMYTFADKGGRSMTLRPEWTAPVVRAALEHSLLAQGPQRLYYIGSIFRYERPQAGRYREAHQFGIECFGFPGPEADVEVIGVAVSLIRQYKLSDVTVRLNSVGDDVCRPRYREALLAHFRPHVAELSADSQSRLERNPLRILDSKSPADAPFVAGAPTLLDSLCDGCREHFDGVRRYLDELGIAYEVDPRIVRGLDYYTRTVFEITSTALGAQSTVCGGGRYDGLVASLGGPSTPAVGFGLGLERFLMMVDAASAGAEEPRRGIQAIALGAAARARLVPLAGRLRAATDVPVFIDYGERKLTAHFKLADRNRARWALILGDNELAADEIVMRDLEQRAERRLPLADAASRVAQFVVEGTSDA